MTIFTELEKTLNNIERQFKPHVEDFEGFNKYLERNKETLEDRIREMGKIINKNLCFDLDTLDLYDWDKIVLENIKLDHNSHKLPSAEDIRLGQYSHGNPLIIRILKELIHKDLNIKMLKDLVQNINSHKLLINMVRRDIKNVNLISSYTDGIKGEIEHLTKVYIEVVDWDIPRISNYILKYHIKEMNRQNLI